MKLLIENYIARHRRLGSFRALANWSQKYLNAWENVNYDPALNGEIHILSNLSSIKFGCMFDVGASIGKWTLMAKKCFPAAHIHCFEAVDSICEELQKSLGKTPGVTINAFGLLNEAKEEAIKYYPKDTGKGSLFDFPHNGNPSVAQAKFMTGDEYMQQEQIDHINFLKLDVEGSEHLVLEGFKSALNERKIDIVQFEYGKLNIVTGFLLHNFYEFFDSLDYKVGKIYPNYVDFRNYDFCHEDFRGPNFLAIRNERTDIIEALRQSS